MQSLLFRSKRLYPFYRRSTDCPATLLRRKVRISYSMPLKKLPLRAIQDLNNSSKRGIAASSTSKFLEISEAVEKHDISLRTKEDIDKVEELICRYEGFESMEEVIHTLGRTQARLICDRGMIPLEVEARLCIIGGKLELVLYNMSNVKRRTGVLLDDALAISDAQEKTTYHPWNDLSSKLSPELSVKYNVAFTRGLQSVFLDTKDISKHQLFYTLMYVYFGRS